MARLKVEVDGEVHSVDVGDVLAWCEVDPAGGPDSDAAAEHAADYVRANPRPDPDAQGAANVPARQRRALLRRLTAGPATRDELTAAMRAAAGYVGGDDWRNRMDELRGRGQRGGGHSPLPLAEDDGVWRLTAPFPALSRTDHGAAAALLAVLDEAGAGAAPQRNLLGHLLPGLAPDGDDGELLAALAEHPELEAASRHEDVGASPPRSADSSRR